jgi:DNA-binding MarR family transcriptional regulator
MNHDELTERAEQLEALLPMAMRALHSGATDPLSEVPLAQLKFLRSLFASSRTLTDLANELHHSVSSATQIVSRLEDSGYVRRVLSTDDRRVRVVELTTAGKELMRGRRANRVERAREVLASLSDWEQEAIITSLERFVTKAREIGIDGHEHPHFTADIETLQPAPASTATRRQTG